MSGRHRKPSRPNWWPVVAGAGLGLALTRHHPAPEPTEPLIVAAPAPTPEWRAVAAVTAVSATPKRVPPLRGAEGLTSATVNLARYIQAHYPTIPAIGGWRADDGYHEHNRGVALDVMVGGETALGDRVCADMLTRPGVRYVIWQQRIRYPSGASRAMPDRGSPTANHMDHVHVRVDEVL